MKKWINKDGFLSKDYSLDEVRKEYQNRLERERNKLLQNFQEGVDYTVSHENDGKKVIYTLNSLRAKKAYFSGPLIESMKYRLEESEKGFSAQVISPVFRVGNKASEFGDKSKVELIDEGKGKKNEASDSQLDDEVESKKRKLDEEANLAEEKAKELQKQAEEARRKKAELENFTPRQQFPTKQ